MIDLVQQLREGVEKKYSRESLEFMLLWAADEIERMQKQINPAPIDIQALMAAGSFAGGPAPGFTGASRRS